MKVGSKLFILMLIVIIIPVVLVNVCASKEFNEFSEEDFEFNISSSSNFQSNAIGMILKEIGSQCTSISRTMPISEFVAGKSENASGGYNKIYTDTMINSVVSGNENLLAICLINSEGKVVATTENDIGITVGKAPEMAEEFDYAKENNGFSGFSIRRVNGKDLATFCYCRPMLDASGNEVGSVAAVCSTVGIQKQLSELKLYNSSHYFIIDGQGNMLLSPYLKITRYDEEKAYQNVYGYFAEAINSETGKLQLFEHNDTETYLYSSRIAGSNWTVFSSVNKYEFSGMIRESVRDIREASIWAVVVSAALAVLITMMFAKPIVNIVSVITKKMRGDKNVRFEVSAYDELGQISMAFNEMFDDTYESEQRYRTIVEMTDNIVFEINFNKDNVYISNNFNQKFSFRAKSDSLQDSFFYRARIHKDDTARYFNDLESMVEGEKAYHQGEYRFKNIYGDFAWFIIRATKFYDRDDVPTKIVGVIVDIDREKKSEMSLIQRANLDALTQLYNRESFIKALAKEFENSIMRKSYSAVLFIDLDDFKYFNDEFGHSCGDEVLKYTADSIKEVTFERGFSGRFGGDEFVICLTDFADKNMAGEVAADIISALNKGFISESTGQSLAINCSIGIAFFNENGKNCEEILNAADEAMYGIKKHGKSNYGFAESRGQGTVPVAKPIDSDIDNNNDDTDDE